MFESAPGVILQFDAQDSYQDEIDLGSKDENDLLSMRDEGHAEMMANLALDNIPALINEGTDDISTDNKADESSNHTEPNNQVTNDESSESLSAEEQVEDRIEEDNE